MKLDIDVTHVLVSLAFPQVDEPTISLQALCLLAIINRHPGISQRDIINKYGLSTSRQGLSAKIQALSTGEEPVYVVNKPDPLGGPLKHLYLTEAGEEFARGHLGNLLAALQVNLEGSN
jgi:DNA-binding MarR family transcriptional regulator